MCHLSLVCLASWPLDKEVPIPEHLLPPTPVPEKLNLEWTLPGFISIFLPEFPHRRSSAQQHLQIIGFIAKGSYGPILKVMDLCKQKIYAIKVLPKFEILNHGVLQQSKEEVIIQQKIQHPFLHNLQDCWQTQHHLFIMCDYYSTGDLYTYWIMTGCFEEDQLRVFAVELGSALGFLHNFGIIHRDVKWCMLFFGLVGHLHLTDFGLSRRLEREKRAFAICGTMQYMAPEVLSGGPYNHAADWWSLGILLFTGYWEGGFPVLPEPEHCSMLRKVRNFPYNMPSTFSPVFTLLLKELLCKVPAHRLHSLERFQQQAFFHGTSFDAQLLQKAPVQLILELKTRADRMVQVQRELIPDSFKNFDWNLLSSPNSPTDLSPTLANLDLNQALMQGQSG
ncbi:putative serine/threonine-protein kinase SgK494-like isoform X1 [Arapaima gigas]